MFIRCGIMLNTRFEKRNSIDVECLFCCTNKHSNAHSSVIILPNITLKRGAFSQVILDLSYVCILLKMR